MRAVELRDDQADLIVLAMQRIRSMCGDPETMHYAVDRLARAFLLRRCQEISDLVQASFPEAGK